ncbi:Transcription factor Pcc1 [Seminavis robusta]|uniref:Transcription factor Pcc1 n=1 Tax=Seminavis robusta TaxID=568900 RepID=A0A9N8EPM1_9STRA|nr:Transcription factor Pcc1 [Seminavis robusta]|eukprot:Sro1384_g268080.1 Transcription factor Pcc1 (89) ;mRNA; f:14460-14854
MSHPYAARIDLTFPDNELAEKAIQVLQVDKEPGDRVVKAFSIVQEESVAVLRVELKATEAKMLRVAVSSFYDFVQVVLKTMQEFDPAS